MNEGAGCRFKQSPLSAPFSLGSAFARRPHPAPLAPLTRLAPASDLRVPGSTQGTARVGEPRDRLGPVSDRALDFYRVPPLGRGCGWDPGRLEGRSEGSEASASRTSARPLVLVGSPPAVLSPRDWLVLGTPGARPLSTGGTSAPSARPSARRPSPLAQKQSSFCPPLLPTIALAY